MAKKKNITVNDIIKIIDDYRRQNEAAHKSAILAATDQEETYHAANRWTISDRVCDDLKWQVESKLGEETA